MNKLTKMTITVLVLSVCYIFLVLSIAYVLPANANNIVLNSDNFTIEGKTSEFTDYKGKTSLLLNNASATLNDISFINGVIEYDVAFAKQRNFVGIKFRQQDGKNAEEFYIRPHQSGNPDANQYTPVFNDLAAWQLYHHGFSGKVNYNFDDWNHIKIVIADRQGEIYINDMHKPAFTIKEFLRPSTAGSISFSSAMADAYIANISIVKNEQPKLLSTIPANNVRLQNYLLDWQISNSFKLTALDKVTNLESVTDLMSNWTPISADTLGIINMAKIQGVQENKNTAFAKTTINSNKKQIKALRFGYSDMVKVYFNKQLIYQGNNSFRSRDYRYLGTIGLFDTLYLPLNEGENEVVFAVSERFGGWGVLAKLED